MCITAKRAYTLASVLVASFGTMAHAEEPTWEDLTACKLPNAKMVLPGQGSPLARKEGGTVFAFATRTFTPEPDFKEGEFTVAKFIAALKGDIYYAVPEGGCFMVASGRIADLGKHYLHEFDSKELPRPDIHTSKEDGQDVPGLVTGIQERTGHCFLLETRDGKAVLLRIVSQDRKSGEALIQWVYQPDGTRLFGIPKSIPQRIPAAGTKGVPALPSVRQLDMRDLAAAADVHLANRGQLVELCVTIIPLKTESLANRNIAVNLVRKMRAVEAAPVLAKEISANLTLQSRRGASLREFPTVDALAEMSIPGATAAIHQLAVDAERDVPAEEKARMVWESDMQLRRELLALVILRVYGEKLAKIVLEDKIAESDVPKVKETYQKALEALPRVKNWLPEEKPTAAAPSATTVPTK